MRLSSALLPLLLSLPALAPATVVRVDGGRLAVVEAADAPARGLTMQAVRQRWGEPRRRIGPVGRPPITRWDYPAFSVYFEGRYVIHSVQTGAPRNPRP